MNKSYQIIKSNLIKGHTNVLRSSDLPFSPKKKTKAQEAAFEIIENFDKSLGKNYSGLIFKRLLNLAEGNSKEVSLHEKINEEVYFLYGIISHYKNFEFYKKLNLKNHIAFVYLFKEKEKMHEAFELTLNGIQTYEKLLHS